MWGLARVEKLGQVLADPEVEVAAAADLDLEPAVVGQPLAAGA